MSHFAERELIDRFEPERLRLARAFAGLSADELGSRSAVSSRHIWKLESGASKPSAEVLEALGAALGFLGSFFTQPAHLWDSDRLLSFRTASRTTRREIRRVRAQASLLQELISRLERSFDLPTPNLPKAQPGDDPETAAQRVRGSWGLGDRGPISSVTRAIESHGIPLAEISESIDVDGVSRAAWRPFIAVGTAKGSGSRRRFDLAHELGHLVYDDDPSSTAPHVEARAHAFAGAFLVPGTAFAVEFEKGERWNWATMFRLKERWGVSVAALVRRALDLSLIDAAMYRRANVHIRSRGWHRGEPLEPPLESPELISHALKLAQSAHVLSELLDDLGWSGETLERVSGAYTCDELPRIGTDRFGVLN